MAKNFAHYYIKLRLVLVLQHYQAKFSTKYCWSYALLAEVIIMSIKEFLGPQEFELPILLYEWLNNYEQKYATKFV